MFLQVLQNLAGAHLSAACRGLPFALGLQIGLQISDQAIDVVIEAICRISDIVAVQCIAAVVVSESAAIIVIWRIAIVVAEGRVVVVVKVGLIAVVEIGRITGVVAETGVKTGVREVAQISCIITDVSELIDNAPVCTDASQAMFQSSYVAIQSAGGAGKSPGLILPARFLRSFVCC